MRMPPQLKLTHVLSQLRKKLSDTQEGFAKRVSLSRRTIQNVEQNGHITKDVALRIAAAVGVSAEWLIRNNLKEPPKTPDGRLWSPREYRVIKNRATSWPGIPDVLHTLALFPYIDLFSTYWRIRTAIEKSPDPILASVKWHRMQRDTLRAFIQSYGAEPDFQPKWEPPLTATIVKAIQSDLAAIAEALPFLSGTAWRAIYGAMIFAAGGFAEPECNNMFGAVLAELAKTKPEDVPTAAELAADSKAFEEEMLRLKDMPMSDWAAAAYKALTGQDPPPKSA